MSFDGALQKAFCCNPQNSSASISNNYFVPTIEYTKKCAFYSKKHYVGFSQIESLKLIKALSRFYITVSIFRHFYIIITYILNGEVHLFCFLDRYEKIVQIVVFKITYSISIKALWRTSLARCEILGYIYCPTTGIIS